MKFMILSWSNPDDVNRCCQARAKAEPRPKVHYLSRQSHVGRPRPWIARVRAPENSQAYRITELEAFLSFHWTCDFERSLRVFQRKTFVRVHSYTFPHGSYPSGTRVRLAAFFHSA
jgi:hypothetical protein